MSKPIRSAYVIFNQKESFFEQKKENIIKSGSIVNIYIVYSLSKKTIGSDNVLEACLFRNLVILQILINTFSLAMVMDLTVRVNLDTLRVEWLEI